MGRMRAHGAGQAAIEFEDAGLQHCAQRHGGGQIAIRNPYGALRMGRLSLLGGRL